MMDCSHDKDAIVIALLKGKWVFSLGEMQPDNSSYERMHLWVKHEWVS